MEKNIHDDRLDDYVKKSFDDYEEDPADNMWARIEGKLLPAEIHQPPGYFWHGYRWQLAAATVILLLISRLVCVQFYYEEKLRSITAQTERSAPNNSTVAPHAADRQSYDIQKPNHAPVELKIPSNTVIPAEAHAQVTTSENSKTSFTTPIATNMTGSAGSENLFVKDRITAPPLEETPSFSSKEQPFALNDTSLFSNIPPVHFANFHPIAQSPQALLITQNSNPTIFEVPTKKFKNNSGWYAGIYVTPHVIVEKSYNPTRPGLQTQRQLYANQQKQPQFSADFSLMVGKKVTTHFAIESGIGFEQLVRTATHRPHFNFREGQPIQIPPGSPASRRFDYDLNTYGGAGSVTLRMEVSGSDTPSENERVGALITSREELQILQIPILGVARFGHGRVQFVVKAGVSGRYLLKNDFSISASSSENAKLRLRSNEGYTVHLSRPQHFLFGYRVSAGAAYRLTKHLSLFSTPALAGDFPRNDPQRGKLPGHAMFGMNIGAEWWF